MSKLRSALAAVADEYMTRYPVIEDVYLPLRAWLFLNKYRERRKHYESICRTQGLVYSEANTIRQVRGRLQRNGQLPRRRRLGEVHTFAFIPLRGWHKHLYPDLYALGSVTEFDYIALGFDSVAVGSPGMAGQSQRRALNEHWYEALVRSHRENPVDWLFVYASGNHVLADTLLRVQNELGIPTVNMCLDDKHSWEGDWLGEQRGLQIDLAPNFDLSWTSSRIATGWYQAEGGRPLFLLEGCDARYFRPYALHQDLPVSFVGRSYGFRNSVIRYLVKNGVEVHTFGQGWENGTIGSDEMVGVFCRSQINLGMGGIGPAEYLTTVKGRDFDVPCTGGGMYLTSFDADLALYFDVGREIVCYRSRDEMLELVNYYLTHPDEAQQIARAGRVRCLREHRWLHRYIKICQILGVLDDALTPAEFTIDAENYRQSGKDS